MNQTKFKTSTLAILSLMAMSSMPVQAQYLEDHKGYVIMEAENTKSPLDKWTKGMLTSTKYTGDGHLEFTGNNPSSGPATSPLEYKIHGGQRRDLRPLPEDLEKPER
jgi:hypothetical protein